MSDNGTDLNWVEVYQEAPELGFLALQKISPDARLDLARADYRGFLIEGTTPDKTLYSFLSAEDRQQLAIQVATGNYVSPARALQLMVDVPAENSIAWRNYASALDLSWRVHLRELDWSLLSEQQVGVVAEAMYTNALKLVSSGSTQGFLEFDELPDEFPTLDNDRLLRALNEGLESRYAETEFDPSRVSYFIDQFEGLGTDENWATLEERTRLWLSKVDSLVYKSMFDEFPGYIRKRLLPLVRSANARYIESLVEKLSSGEMRLGDKAVRLFDRVQDALTEKQAEKMWENVLNAAATAGQVSYADYVYTSRTRGCSPETLRRLVSAAIESHIPVAGKFINRLPEDEVEEAWGRLVDAIIASSDSNYIDVLPEEMIPVAARTMFRRAVAEKRLGDANELRMYLSESDRAHLAGDYSDYVRQLAEYSIDEAASSGVIRTHIDVLPQDIYQVVVAMCVKYHLNAGNLEEVKRQLQNLDIEDPEIRKILESESLEARSVYSLSGFSLTVPVVGETALHSIRV